MQPNAPSFTGLIGVARDDITPSVGIYSRSWGAAKHDTSEGIHRPLTLTCITFQSRKKEKPLVLLSADLGWWKSKEDEWFVRGEILKALSLDVSRVMFCFSHTHAGPSLFRGDSTKPGGHLIEPYLTHLRDTAVTAAHHALKNAAPATLTWTYGQCDLATDRDLPEESAADMLSAGEARSQKIRGNKTSSGRYLCGFNPPEKSDHTLLIGRITDTSEKIIGTIVNYACHPTTLAWENHLLSPDYIGAMREVVETQTDAPCLFLQGASGELAPAEQYVGDISIPDAHGRKLGFAVLSTLAGMLPPKTTLHFQKVVESGAPLAIWKRTTAKISNALCAEKIEVELPLKSLPTLAEIEKEWRECTDPVLKERLCRKMGVRKNVGDGRTTKMPLWVWQLGDAFLIGQPNEAYSDFQQSLRKQFPDNAVAVMNVVNGHTGYLPPKKLYGKNIYAVWQTPFAKGSLELLTRTAVDAVKNLSASDKRRAPKSRTRARTTTRTKSRITHHASR